MPQDNGKIDSKAVKGNTANKLPYQIGYWLENLQNNKNRLRLVF